MEAECKNVYPKFLCASCTRKIRHLESKTVPELQTAATFYPHNDNDCEVCQTLTAKSSRSKDLPVKYIDKAFEACNFVKIMSGGIHKRVFEKHRLNSDDKTIKEITFYINHDNSWECVALNNKCIRTSISDHTYLKMETLKQIENIFTKNSLCRGISGFEDVIQSRLDMKLPFHASVLCESDQQIPLLDKHDYKIIRHRDCKIIMENDPSNLCENCKQFIPYLKKCKIRSSETPTSSAKEEALDSSHTNYRFLSREELIERLQHAQKKKKDALQKLAYINAKIKDDVGKKGVVLESTQHDLFQKILTSSETPDFDQESPQWLLWQQQRLQASKTNSKGMRWHPLIMRYI